MALEDPSLTREAAAYAAASLRASTRRAYSTGQRRWLQFAAQRGFSAFPLTETAVTLWVTDLARSLAPTTVDSYLSATLRLARELGYPCERPQFQMLSDVLQGIRNVKSASFREVRRPLTCKVLAAVQPQLDMRTGNGRMLWAAMTLGTLGLLRSGEFALDETESVLSPKLLRVDSVRFEHAQGSALMRVRLRDTKTDRARVGVTVTVGPTGRHVCAVTAMASYLSERSAALPADPLFVFEDDSILRRRSLVRLLKVLLSNAGVDSSLYAGHSFRIGGATDLASRGVPDHEIQAAGRWTSDAFKRYVRFADERHLSRAAIMARSLG